MKSTWLRNTLQARVEIPMMATILQLQQDCRVLEVGCGRGNALAPLSRQLRPRTLSGIDIDPAQLSMAQLCAQAASIDVSLHCGDLRNLPFAGGQFDLVVDFGTCYHVDAPDRALAEISRVLGDGGVAVLESPLAQMLAHPRAATRRRLPSTDSFDLHLLKHAALWSLYQKGPANISERRKVESVAL